MSTERKTYICYTDGGARGNPGPAGIGVYVTDGDGNEVKKVSRFLGEATNNFAEYEAVISALETLKKMIPKSKRSETDIEIRMDSEFVQRQLTGKYQIKEPTLFPQFIRVWNMRVAEFPNVTFTHVRREENKEADKLANEAMDKSLRSNF